jgi:hypothetical protein
MNPVLTATSYLFKMNMQVSCIHTDLVCGVLSSGYLTAIFYVLFTYSMCATFADHLVINILAVICLSIHILKHLLNILHLLLASPPYVYTIFI